MFGDTVTEVLDTVPTPLSILTELVLPTVQDKIELCPLCVVVGLATNETMVGRVPKTIAEQVVVATVDDASVAPSVVLYVPGE